MNFSDEDEYTTGCTNVKIVLHDFTALHSLSLSDAQGIVALTPSLQRLRVDNTNLHYITFPSQLETLWINDSRIRLSETFFGPIPSPPFKRLYLVNRSELPSTLLQGCGSTLEHIVLHDTSVSFPIGSLYPRLRTLYYESLTSEDESQDTLHSLLQGSLLTHLNCYGFCLPPLYMLTRHATHLVYLELFWKVWSDKEVNAYMKEDVIDIYTEGEDTLEEEQRLFFDTLTQLNVLQHLVLYGPPFLKQGWVKALPSSPLAFPQLRSFTTERPREDRFSGSSDTLSVIRLDRDTVTLCYLSVRSRTFHVPRVSPISPLSTNLWRYSDAPPLEHIHPALEHDWEAQWTCSKKTRVWIAEVLPELVEWCNVRDAVAMFRPVDGPTPLLLLHGAIFHTTCPYDDCVCRL